MNGACPNAVGDNTPAPPQSIKDDNGDEIGTIPNTLDLVFYDKKVIPNNNNPNNSNNPNNPNNRWGATTARCSSTAPGPSSMPATT